MKENLITLQTAKLAKEKGFNIKCLNFYVRSNCKMFGIDEYGRFYSIQKSTKSKIYTIGSHATLNKKNLIFAPTQSLLQKWLREEHDIYLNITTCGYDKKYHEMRLFRLNKECYTYYADKTFKNGHFLTPYKFESYEEALEVGLFEALKLISR